MCPLAKFITGSDSDYRGDKLIMTNKVHPWAIVRLRPDLCRVTISRFRKSSDAESYLLILRRLEPGAEFTIVFDPNDLTSSTLALTLPIVEAT